MNRYKITYSLKNETGYIDASIVERDECSAKKALKAMLKEEGKKLDGISEITVQSVNLPATKQQEREALEEIKAIVASLGETSYLATAFEGCFEDAENNIDDDAAYSMKDRWVSSEEKLAAANKKISNMELDNRDLRLALEKAKQEAADAQQALRDKTLSPDDMEDVQALVQQDIFDLESNLKEAAQAIVQHADKPESEEFKQAVRDHRNLAGKLEYYKALNNRIIAAQKAGA